MAPMNRLRGALDRDVYQIVKKLEESANDNKPFKSIHTVYDAIQRSNSSLKRQKKRPLEDAIDRVLQFRKEELGESDSEAEIEAEEEIAKQEDDRFLLNRQMTKHWHTARSKSPKTQASAGKDPSKADLQSQDDMPAKKKRRMESEAEEKDGGVSGNDVTWPIETQQKKKSSRPSRFTVDQAPRAPQLGGVKEMHDKVWRYVRGALQSPKAWGVYNWRPCLGMVLTGPKGCGKKSLIRSVAAACEVPLINLTPCFRDPDRLEKSLSEAMDEATRIAPCIVLIERLDQAVPKPGGSNYHEHHSKAARVLEDHLGRLQNQPADQHVLAVATSSDITAIDRDVLNIDCFEMMMQMKIPSVEAREEIFGVILKDAWMADDVSLAELAKITHGFVGSDIKMAVSLAQHRAEERGHKSTSQAGPDSDVAMDDHSMDGALLTFDKDQLLTMSDLMATIKGFTPSLRKEGFSVIPNVTWNQVGALEKAREQLEMSIVGPIRNPTIYEEWGISRPAGVLLWGPPGCGKTLIAQAVANEAQASFILINGPELLNKYVGESERAVRELFQRARSSTPCILFFDEMDSLVPKREGGSTEAGVRIVNALLTELDGVQDRSGVYVIGTTNRPDMIDPAMLRPGRLSVRIFLDLPTPAERIDILTTLFRSNHVSATPNELSLLEKVATHERCKDFSGADLNGLRVKAAENGMRRFLKSDGKKVSKEVGWEDWENALMTTTRSVINPETYRSLDKKLGRD